MKTAPMKNKTCKIEFHLISRIYEKHFAKKVGFRRLLKRGSLCGVAE